MNRIRWIIAAVVIAAVPCAELGLGEPAPASAGFTPVDSLTVAECVALARTHAPAVRAAQFDRVAALGDSTATGMNARPASSLLAGATVAPKGFYDPAITNLGEYQLKLAMGWTAADGGRRARERERSGLGARTARTREALESREAGLLAADLALRLLRLQQQIELQQQGIDWLNRLGSLVGSGVTSGMRGSSDSIRVTLELDAVTAAMDLAKLEQQTTRFDLASLIGRDIDAAIAIREPEASLERAPAPADSVTMMSSIETQPEVAIARTGEQLSRLDILDTQRRNAHAIQVVVDAGLAGTDLTRRVPPDLKDSDPNAGFTDRLRRDLGASAAVQFQLPLLDRATRPALDARKAATSAAEIRSAAELAAQRRRAEALLAQWRSAWHQLDASQRTYARAERSLLRIRSLYTAGATTLLDLLDAWRVFTDARDRWVSARQENRMAQVLVEDRR